jgi:hypothetical protein
MGISDTWIAATAIALAVSRSAGTSRRCARTGVDRV